MLLEVVREAVVLIALRLFLEFVGRGVAELDLFIVVALLGMAIGVIVVLIAIQFILRGIFLQVQ